MLLILNVEDSPAASSIVEIGDNETVDLLSQMVEVQLGKLFYLQLNIIVNIN
jgi:hypothetical protein